MLVLLIRAPPFLKDVLTSGVYHRPDSYVKENIKNRNLEMTGGWE